VDLLGFFKVWNLKIPFGKIMVKYYAWRQSSKVLIKVLIYGAGGL
jgi:hypothetical protein